MTVEISLLILAISWFIFGVFGGVVTFLVIMWEDSRS